MFYSTDTVYRFLENFGNFGQTTLCKLVAHATIDTRRGAASCNLVCRMWLIECVWTSHPSSMSDFENVSRATSDRCIAWLHIVRDAFVKELVTLLHEKQKVAVRSYRHEVVGMKPRVHTRGLLLGIAKTSALYKIQLGFREVRKALPYPALEKVSVWCVWHMEISRALCSRPAFTREVPEVLVDLKHGFQTHSDDREPASVCLVP